MEFYQILSQHYDEIFPLKDPQKRFLQNYFNEEGIRSILDVGCGTGSLAVELSQKGILIHGVDLSNDMIRIAEEKAKLAGSPATFSVADMSNLSRVEGNFEGIVCLGNTLPHVSGESELRQVLAQFRQKATRVLVQTVNYDRIAAKQIKELPLIQTPNLSFRRYYTFNSDGGLDFTMKITFHDSAKELTGVNRLYPVPCQDLLKAFEKEGWEVAGLWGDYKNDQWSQDSPATIVAARLAK